MPKNEVPIFYYDNVKKQYTHVCGVPGETGTLKYFYEYKL